MLGTNKKRIKSNSTSKAWFPAHSYLRKRFFGATYNIQHTTYNEGFSLIELMVTVSIIAIISSIVLFNFPSFASRILLENLTHEIALVVRQAQVYGIGIKRQAGTTDVFPAYGAHFDVSATPAGNPPNKKAIFFADLPAGIGNGQYDGSGEDVEIFSIQRGNIISELCYQDDIAAWQCGANTLDITFRRPEPEAQIFAAGVGGGLSAARIAVTSPNPEIGNRYITVYSSGQIAVMAE